jgi:hypothetical protein
MIGTNENIDPRLSGRGFFFKSKSQNSKVKNSACLRMAPVLILTF